MTIRVVVADDQDIVRTGLRMILDAQPGIEVVGEAADGREAVELARRLRPDVCLFDIRMPELDGIEATRRLAGPDVDDPLAVVVITTFDLDDYVHGALKAGARGFLLKDAGPELLAQAVHAAARGDALIAPSVTARLLSTFADVRRRAPRRRSPIDPLTDREEEVLVTVARGRTNAEIRRFLGTDPRVVQAAGPCPRQRGWHSSRNVRRSDSTASNRVIRSRAASRSSRRSISCARRSATSTWLPRSPLPASARSAARNRCNARCKLTRAATVGAASSSAMALRTSKCRSMSCDLALRSCSFWLRGASIVDIRTSCFGARRVRAGAAHLPRHRDRQNSCQRPCRPVTSNCLQTQRLICDRRWQFLGPSQYSPLRVVELTPLAEIEQRVQARAKDIALDMATADGRGRLRALIDDEVARWSDDFRRGRRDFDLADPDVVAERAYRNLAGYGPLEPLLADDDVWEVMINAPDQIFVKRHRGPVRLPRRGLPRRRARRPHAHQDPRRRRRTAHRKLDATEGLQDAQLDDGARLHIVHGDIARGGHVMVNIRKFTGVQFRNLDELVERDMLTAQAAAVPAGLRAGPALDRLRRRARLGQDDDAVVLRRRARPGAAGRRSPRRSSRPTSRCRTWRRMQTRPARAERRAVDLRRLVAGFLRMAPDVAIVGEVRDREALPAAAHAVVGRQGLHHDPRRLGPPGAHPAAVHLPARRHVVGAPAVGAQHARVARPSTSSCTAPARTAGPPGHRDRLRRGPRRRRRTPPSSRSPRCSPGRGRDLPLAWTGNLPVRAARPLREAGPRRPRPARTTRLGVAA